MIKWITFILAAAGLSIGIYTAATAQHEAPKVPLAGEPSVNPYKQGIAATGQVEAATRNVNIAAPEGALVVRVLAEVGQRVKAGDPLFELDARTLQAELIRARGARQSAEAALRKVELQPRAEELPPLEAEVQAMESEVADWQDQYEKYGQARALDAAGQYEQARRKFALDGAKARLAGARARLALLKAGAWSAEVDVARAGLAAAEADIRALELLIERRTVRAPFDGTVLKRNVEPGQFAPADPSGAAMVLGDLSTLHVRARVDEEDLPLLRMGAAAQARVRGQKAILVPLTMIRIEPLAQPKVQLSGATTERVDTRVLEVVFRVEGAAALYPGQLVDVFIDGGEG